jgi:predicted anti-sigma-YlaC factor YlaD
MKLTCEDLVKHLSDYLDNELDEELSRAAQEHLGTCENCKVVLDTTKQTILLYKKNRIIELPSSRKNQLYDQIAKVFSQENSAE